MKTGQQKPYKLPHVLMRKSGRKTPETVRKHSRATEQYQTTQICVIGEEREKRVAMTFTEIMAKNLPKLTTDTKPETQA